MKLIIVGPRNYTNYELVKYKLDYLLQNVKVTEIVSGGCRGVDKLGEQYGKERGIQVRVFEADWSLGKFAGPKRNAEMCLYSDALIAFDAGTRGTDDMISKAQERGLKVKIVKI